MGVRESGGDSFIRDGGGGWGGVFSCIIIKY